MSGDALLVLVRALHLLAAAAWIGGAIVYAVVRPGPSSAGRSFTWVVQLSTWLLVATGVVMTFDRLSGVDVSALYTGGLALKVALAVAMFLLAGTLAPSSIRRLRAASANRPYLVLGLGVAVYVLGSALAVAYTRSLRP